MTESTSWTLSLERPTDVMVRFTLERGDGYTTSYAMDWAMAQCTISQRRAALLDVVLWVSETVERGY